jgi:hypothetical protein
VLATAVELDAAFLRQISQTNLHIDQKEPKAITDLLHTRRTERRRAIEYAVEQFGTGRDLGLELFLGWPARCAEMGYGEKAKPVIIIIDYGENADEKWRTSPNLPRQYNGFPIRYRFSPPAEAQVGAGSAVSGVDVGTLGGVLQDVGTNTYYGLTCAHVAGGKGNKVSEVDKKNNVIGNIGTVVDSTIPAVAAGACNAHAQPGAGLDAALIDASGCQTVVGVSGATVQQIADTDQDDPITFIGGKSGPVHARVAAATIWKEISVAGQRHCFGDIFAIGHHQVTYVLQAVSQGGDSGTWIFDDPPPNSASARWLGMLIAGDKQQNQSLACYSEHLFTWARKLVPNIALLP